jgi:predicted nucleotidyltransferase
MALGIPVDMHEIGEFCRRWKIACLELFGSVVRGDFRPDSDVDLLVTFAPDADWGLLDHAAMQRELCGIFGREVDLLTRDAVEHSRNPLRREAILNSARPLHVQG